MKKILLFMLVLFFSNLNAQLVHFGVKGGYNSATFSGIDGTKALSGYYVGALANIDLKIISIQPELVYSAQGSAFDNGGDYKLNYLNIPVMVKFDFLKILYVEAGPQLGYLMTAKDGSEDIIDSFESTDVSVGVGAGVEIFNKFDIGFRLNFGTTEIDKQGLGAKNEVYQVGLTYKF